MTLAGSIPIVCYLICFYILGDRLPIKFYVFILRAAIVFYLCLFQILKYLLPAKLINLSQGFEIKTYTRTVNVVDYINMQKIDGNYLIYPSYIPIVYIVCLLAFTVCAFITWYRYFRSLKELLLTSDIIDDDISKFIDEHPQLKKLNRKSFCVFEQEYADTPFIVGFRSLSIVLPKQKFNEKQKEYIYSHELSHILHHDIIWKALCTMALLLHWYNPFVYVLSMHHSNLCEYYADEHCTKDMSKDDQKKYVEFIIKLASVSSYNSEHDIPNFSNSFSGGKESMKKRVDFIFNKRKPSKIVRILSVLCTCVMILMSSLTVLAYDAGIEDNVPLEEAGDNSTVKITYTSDKTYSSVPKTALNFSESSCYFVDENGNIIPLFEETSNIEPHALCFHSYTSGTKEVHTLYSNGSCQIKYYKATICIKCGKCITGDLANTATWTKCPH